MIFHFCFTQKNYFSLFFFPSCFFFLSRRWRVTSWSPMKSKEKFPLTSIRTEYHPECSHSRDFCPICTINYSWCPPVILNFPACLFLLVQKKFFNDLIFEQWVSDLRRGVRHGDFVSLYDGPCQEIMDWHWQIPKSWTWQLTDAVRSVPENSLRLGGQKQCEYHTLVWFWVFQTKCVESEKNQASSGSGKAGGEGMVQWNLYIEPNTSVTAEFFTDYG